MNQKIKDKAREKIAKMLRRLSVVISDEEQEWVAIGAAAREAYRKEADQILSLSGETDEVCYFCEGKKKARPFTGLAHLEICPKCKGTGTIKKKWHYGAIDENGREII